MLKKSILLFLALRTLVSMYDLAGQSVSTTDSLYTSLNKRGVKTSHKLDILNEIINYHYLSDQYDEMKSAIDRAYKLLQGSDDSCFYNKFLLTEAKYISAVGDKKEAVSITNKILFSAQSNECADIEISTLLFQAKLLLRHTNPDSCLKKIMKARALAVEIKDELLIARTYNMEGILNYSNNNFSESRKLMFSAIKTFRKFDEVEMLGKAYSDIAYTYYLQSAYDSALVYNKIAESHLQNTESFGDRVENYNQMALVYQNTGKLNEAIEAFFKGLRIADLINSSRARTLILYNLGNCYYQLDANDKAIENFRFCLEQAVLDSDTLLMIYANNALGNLALENNKIDTAAKYISKTYDLAKIIDDTYMLMFSSSSMATVEIERENFKLAQEYLDKSYTYAKELNNPSDLININMAQADLYSKFKLYNKAINLLNETYTNAIHIKSISDARYILIALAEIYEESGDFENALNFSKKANTYRDSLNTVSVLANLVKTENMYEQGKLEKIQQLEFEKAELKRVSELENTKLFISLLIISIITLVVTTLLFYKLSETRKKNNQNLKDKNRLIQTHSDELKKLVDELQKITNDLDLSNKTKTKLLSVVGHDLKSPFNVILGFADLLNTGYEEFSELQRKEMVSNIDKSSKIAFKLLEDLLTWSRSQQGEILINKELFNLKKLIIDICAPYEMIAKNKNINLLIDVSEDIEINVDGFTISSAIGNIISNAIKFTPNGGQVTISAQTDEDIVKLNIEDTGIGINKELIQKLFIVGENKSSPGTNNEIGTGLGLIICKEFITRNGGEISVKSEEGKGSIFTFTLPY